MKLILAFAIAASAFAQSAAMVPEALQGVTIEQKLNTQVPVDQLTFTDEAGVTAPLSRFFTNKPVVLAMVYFECPMLCNMTINGLHRAIRALPLKMGSDYDVIAVSFDSRETPANAAARKKSARAGWHFLTGNEENISALAKAVGFKYRWEAKTNQFVHSTALMVLTPQARLSRYLYGVEYSARDLRLALVDASSNRIGSPVDQVLLYCFHYDPATGQYTFFIRNVLRAVAGLFAVAMIAMLVLLRRGEKNELQQLPTIS